MEPSEDSVGVPLTGGGPWTQVHSGRQFPLLTPSADLIFVGDIAASLSKLCRFGGHCGRFYSVAQHSVIVSRIVPVEDALWGLLHDAAEAYIGDLTRPLKIALQGLAPGAVRLVESGILKAVAQRYRLSWPMPASVIAADNVALATERRDLMAPSPLSWGALPDPLPDVIEPWSVADAEAAFLDRFHELAGGA